MIVREEDFPTVETAKDFDPDIHDLSATDVTEHGVVLSELRRIAERRGLEHADATTTEHLPDPEIYATDESLQIIEIGLSTDDAAARGIRRAAENAPIGADPEARSAHVETAQSLASTYARGLEGNDQRISLENIDPETLDSASSSADTVVAVADDPFDWSISVGDIPAQEQTTPIVTLSERDFRSLVDSLYEEIEAGAELQAA